MDGSDDRTARVEQTGAHRTMPLRPQDHSRSVTIAGRLPRRIPSPRAHDSATTASVASGSQPRITLRIGRGVAAVERSRRIRTAAERARARAWRIGNIALTVVIVAAAVWAGWEWWQRWHPQLHVNTVNVTVAPPLAPCNAAYDLVGAIASNGKAGMVTYQWVRSDGTATKRLTVNVPAGQRTTTVHLRWTFTGSGSQPAAATLKIFKPNEIDAAGQFTYTCVS